MDLFACPFKQNTDPKKFYIDFKNYMYDQRIGRNEGREKLAAWILFYTAPIQRRKKSQKSGL